MNRFYKYVCFLIVVFLSASCSERHVTGPLPTEIKSNEKEGEHSATRKAWIESMHKAAPGVNWREMEYQNTMERHIKRTHLRGQVRNRGDWEELIEEKYRGKWSERGSKNQAGSVFDTEFDPDTEELWLISAGGTLFKGSLAGQDWNPVNEDIVFDKGMLKVIPTVDGRNIVALINARPHYSTDEGLTWKPSTGFNYFAGGSKSIVILNDLGNTIYILAFFNGRRYLMVSKDQGVSYSEISSFAASDQPFIFGSSDLQELFLLQVKSSENRIFKLNNEDTWVLLSQSQGGTYDGSDINMSGYVENGHLSLLTYDNENRVLVSQDSGATWSERGQLPVTPWAVGLYQSPSDPNFLMIGDIECYRSLDGGFNWHKVHDWWLYYNDVDGKLHADMMHFKEFVDKNGEQFLLISNHGGLNISKDKLGTVNNLSLLNLNVAQYYDVVSSPSLPGWIFAGSQDQGWQRGHSDTDENLNMEQVVSGDYGHMVIGEDQVSLWTVYPFGSINFYNRADINFSSDAWYEIESEDEFIWINPTSSVKEEGVNGIYVAGGNISGEDGSYIIKLTYNSALRNIEAEQIDYNFKEFTDDGLISAIEVSPINSNIIFAATTNGRFFYSYDAGQNWEQNINFIPEGHYLYGQNVLASQKDENKVWLAGSGYSNPPVYYSADGGQSFRPMNTGLPSTLVFELAMNEDETIMLAATEHGPYMYIFEDSRWYDISGISAPNQRYWSVDYIEDLKVARFGTYGRGVWDVELENITVVPTDEVWAKQAIAVYPNPVDNLLKIETEMRKVEEVMIQLYDIQGNLQFVQKKLLNSGADMITINMDDYISGHYTLKITGTSQQALRSIIKL